MNEVMLPPRGGNVVTVIGETLEPYETAFAVARRCSEWRTTLPTVVVNLATARIVRAQLLPAFDQIYFAARALSDMLSDNPRQRITKPDAAQALGFLFAALRQNDKGDAASLLAACTEMLTQSDPALASVIGVKPLPQHPAVLALAIRRIIATAIFPPQPSEVRKAMLEVRDKILLLQTDVRPVLALARAAERIAFKNDRDAWAAPYTSGAVPSAVAGYLVDDSDDEMQSAVDELFDDEEQAP
jgi:hypothetical protein